jgi:acyl-CoA synthetase (NDP forming)
MEGMEAAGTREAIHQAFNARSIALVGASGDPRKFGYMALNTLIQGGFDGEIYPVSPRGGELMGLKVRTAVAQIPGKLDLAVVSVPAESVPAVLLEAAEKGARAAVILSGGFGEAGRPDLEAKIAAISRERGIRIMGPNIQGIIYLPNRLCAMFFPVIKTPGPLAVISQSGSVTAALSEWAQDEGLGISAAVNLGNQVDLCDSDYVEFFASDEYTGAIAMYVEGLKDGRRFLAAVQRAAARKPVAILKAGKTAAGKRSAASHTGALASDYGAFRSACLQHGAYVAEDLESLYDAAKGLATIRPPRGNRVLSISSSGGAGTLAADQAEARGLSMPLLPPDAVAAIQGMGPPPLATLSNPLDMVSIAGEDFRKVLRALDPFDVTDTFLLNFADPISGGAKVAKELASRGPAGLAVAYFGGGEEERRGRLEMQEAAIAVFPTPERAMKGIAAAVWWADYRRRRGLL